MGRPIRLSQRQLAALDLIIAKKRADDAFITELEFADDLANQVAQIEGVVQNMWQDVVTEGNPIGEKPSEVTLAALRFAFSPPQPECWFETIDNVAELVESVAEFVETIGFAAGGAAGGKLPEGTPRNIPLKKLIELRRSAVSGSS